MPATVDEAKAYLTSEGYDLLAKRPGNSVDAAIAAIKAADIPVTSVDADLPEFDRFLTETDYASNYPKYVKHFGRKGEEGLRRKFFEQFISLRTVAPHDGGSYLDVAAAGGPWVDIVVKKHPGSSSYMQDIRYEEGVVGNKIGSNADSIPMPDASFDGIVSLNAIEHFENRHDLGFLNEVARLLKPGGTICIVPYVLQDVGYSVTAPSKWLKRSEIDTEMPVFDRRLPVVVDETCNQRCVKVPSAATFIEDARSVCEIQWEVAMFRGLGDFKFQRSMLVGKRK